MHLPWSSLYHPDPVHCLTEFLVGEIDVTAEVASIRLVVTFHLDTDHPFEVCTHPDVYLGPTSGDPSGEWDVERF